MCRVTLVTPPLVDQRHVFLYDVMMHLAVETECGKIIDAIWRK